MSVSTAPIIAYRLPSGRLVCWDCHFTGHGDEVADPVAQGRTLDQIDNELCCDGSEGCPCQNLLCESCGETVGEYRS